MSYVNSLIFIDFLRVDLNQEDSEGGPTADAPTKDDQKTDEIAIVETEEILVIVPEAIEYVTIAPEKKAGVTEAGDAIEDQRVDGIRDQLENPKISRKEESPYIKQAMLIRAGKVVGRKRRNRLKPHQRQMKRRKTERRKTAQ